MTKKPLDPNLASILDSIRATVGGTGDRHPPGAEDQTAGLDDAAGAEVHSPAWSETGVETGAESGAATDRSSATRAAAGAGKAPAAEGKTPPRKSVPPATRTVEAFLAELIRPQVDAWLSAHLPEIIQKQAAEEIARLTGKKTT